MDADGLREALIVLRAIQRNTRATWSSALGVARPMAWAPWTAGRGAAREAAWSCAGAAGWAAARVAVRELAGDRARALVRDISGDAAAMMVRAGRSTGGRRQARGSAHSLLAPTLETLRGSALSLLEWMLPTVELGLAAVGPRDNERLASAAN